VAQGVDHLRRQYFDTLASADESIDRRAKLRSARRC
jgi:hypothetical protein